jgi:hypothetical protein
MRWPYRLALAGLAWAGFSAFMSVGVTIKNLPFLFGLNPIFHLISHLAPWILNNPLWLLVFFTFVIDGLAGYLFGILIDPWSPLNKKFGLNRGGMTWPYLLAIFAILWAFTNLDVGGYWYPYVGPGPHDEGIGIALFNPPWLFTGLLYNALFPNGPQWPTSLIGGALSVAACDGVWGFLIGLYIEFKGRQRERRQFAAQGDTAR